MKDPAKMSSRELRRELNRLRDFIDAEHIVLQTPRFQCGYCNQEYESDNYVQCEHCGSQMQQRVAK